MWKKQKIFETLTPFTLLDFENTPSAILWFSGCNMRCAFCYNPEIVYGIGEFCFDDFSSFFEARQNLLKGIVLCGGEPTIHTQIIEIATYLKKLNYKIKLDTNGLKPEIIKIMLQENLVDYIALDFKAPQEKFEIITKSTKNKYQTFTKTLSMLVEKEAHFEVRTTFCDSLLDINDIKIILKNLEILNYKGTYYLQNFIHQSNNIGDISQNNSINLFKELDNLNKYNFTVKFRNF
ncbi:MAG: anaerobic ribonucleoside-triphosphate reductase activating protein [Arcobacteraceae bacterium]|nr:anaerobic ribonucleoside-triphosphate reductase activating protein [Arcobacteraceae bacterium]